MFYIRKRRDVSDLLRRRLGYFQGYGYVKVSYDNEQATRKSGSNR